MALLSVNNVTMSYDGNTVVKNLSFNINAGDYLCIVGENGSGKSTLMKGMLGLKAPSQGEFSFSDGLRSTEIGYLPQQTGAQKDFPASVWEVVLSGGLNSKSLLGFYNRQDKQAAMKNMEKLKISDLKKQCYRELSGGQQQRVLLARALGAASKMILLDEPVSGLDPLATADMYALIRRLNRAEKMTVVMVSHDIASVVDEATHVLHLSGNREFFFGTAEEYHHSKLGGKFLYHSCNYDAHKNTQCPCHHSHRRENGNA